MLSATLRRMILVGLQVIDFHKEERRLEDAFIDMLGRMDQEAGDALPPLPPEAAATPDTGESALVQA